MSNSADAVVSDLDIVLHQKTDSPSTEVGVDREFTLPRGIWFIEFIPGRDRMLSWRAPVPVREADGMEVFLAPAQSRAVDVDNGNDEPASPSYVLRPHAKESVNGTPRPHFVIQELRYVLHGEAWKRDERGRPVKADPLPDDEEARRVTAGNLVREAQLNRALSSRRVNGDLEALLRYTIEVLCRTRYPDAADLYEDAMSADLKVDPEVLPGASYLRRPGTGGTLVLGLHEPSGATLVLAQSGDCFPQRVQLKEQGTGAQYYIGDKLADGVIAVAGASVIGKKRAFELRDRKTVQWIRTEADRWKWIHVMRTMVAEAQGSQIRESPDAGLDLSGPELSP